MARGFGSRTSGSRAGGFAGGRRVRRRRCARGASTAALDRRPAIRPRAMRRRSGGACATRLRAGALRSRRALLRSPPWTSSLTYRGRAVTPADVAHIRAVLTAHAGHQSSRAVVGVCEAWQWRQPNGTPCDAICRGLLLCAASRGPPELPPPRWTTRKPWRPRTSAPPVLIDTTPIDDGAAGAAASRDSRRCGARRDEGALQQPARAVPLSRLPAAGRRAPEVPGVRRAGGRWRASRGRRRRGTSGCATASSAGRAEARRRNCGCSPYNTRFLILPWVSVPASGVACARPDGRERFSADWASVYGHPIYFLETFVDPARFRGTCYRAANWIVLGPTTGRGHGRRPSGPTRPVKEVLGYPLTPRLPQRLAEG